MSIVVNGTTIPENVANALNVNGTNITSVICNGTTVWAQSLFNALWSGNSFAGSSGIQTSGSSYRAYYASGIGNWQTVSISGIFSGDTTTTDGITNRIGFSVSNNLIRSMNWYAWMNRWEYSSTWVTFTKSSTTFTGSSYIYTYDEIGYGDGLDTSGGLVRYKHDREGYATGYGAYISLT